MEKELNQNAFKKAIAAWEGMRFSISSLEASIQAYLEEEELNKTPQPNPKQPRGE
jgi:hypothetical protein